MKLLHEIGKEMIQEEVSNRARVVFEDVEDVLGVPIQAILGPGQVDRIRKARRLTYFLLVRAAGLSLSQAARVCLRRDHSTVLHGVKQFEKSLQSERWAQKSILVLCRMRGV